MSSCRLRRWAVGVSGWSRKRRRRSRRSPRRCRAQRGRRRVGGAPLERVDPGDEVAGEILGHHRHDLGALAGSTPSPTSIPDPHPGSSANPNCPNLVVPKHIRLTGRTMGPAGPPDDRPPRQGQATETSTTAPTTTTTALSQGLDTYRFRGSRSSPSATATTSCRSSASPTGPGRWRARRRARCPWATPATPTTPSPLASARPTWRAPRPNSAATARSRCRWPAAGVLRRRVPRPTWSATASTTASTAAPPGRTGARPRARSTALRSRSRATSRPATTRSGSGGVRQNANGTISPALVATGGTTAIATVAVGEPPPTTSPPTTSRPRPNNNGQAPTGSGPADDRRRGLRADLDHDTEEGEEDATLPRTPRRSSRLCPREHRFVPSWCRSPCRRVPGRLGLPPPHPGPPPRRRDRSGTAGRNHDPTPYRARHRRGGPRLLRGCGRRAASRAASRTRSRTS